MDIRAHNRRAWDRQVEEGNPWTVPASPEAVAAARDGRWEIFLTPTKPAPRDWLPALKGSKILCLASGGGQQGPILAAAGAEVTVFDNSPKQLEQDRRVAAREGLSIETVEGDMADLGNFSPETFDAIVHPVANLFVPDLRPVWQEAFRVLRRGGVLVSGFNNPAAYLFDDAALDGMTPLEAKRRLPYADSMSLTKEERRRYEAEGVPFEYSHTLDDQLGGQLAAGFVLTGFYEDGDRPEGQRALRQLMPIYIATRAAKV